MNMSKEYKENIDGFCEYIFPKETDGVLIQGSVDLINHFSQKKLMLPTTSQQVDGLAKKGTIVVAKSPVGEVVGTAAYTQFYDKSIWEFGGWAVSEDYQNKGVGIMLLKKLFSKLPHFQTIAFGNSNSGPIFEKLGAKIVTDHSVIPVVAFDLCKDCPRKPTVGCCDTIYNLEPVVAKFGMPDYSWMTIRQQDRLVWGFGEPQSSTYKGYSKDPSEWY